MEITSSMDKHVKTISNPHKFKDFVVPVPLLETIH